MSDLISREAAIEALMVAIDDVGILDSDDVKVVFDNLPSAQPVGKDINVPCKEGAGEEQKRCATCGYHYPDEPYCSRMGIRVDDDFFCRDWEKEKTDED